MATNALIRLRTIFALEEKTGWRDRAVVGGMAALQERWSEGALEEGVGAGLVREVVARLLRYAEADAADRPQIAHALLHLLDNLPGSETDPTLAGIDQVATSQTERPSRPAVMPEAVIPPAGPTPVSTRNEPSVSAAQKLDAPVSSLRGVGPARAEQLARLGVQTV